MITGLTRLIRPFRSGLVEYRIRNAVLPALVRGWGSTRGMNSQAECNTPYFTRVEYSPARDTSVKEKGDKTDNDMVKEYALEMLRNLKGFLRRVNSDDYKHFDDELRGSIGQHFRHLSDHFVKIVDMIGDKSGVIEFDNRQPGGILEEDPVLALEQVNTLKSKICHLTPDELDQVIKVAFMAHPREYSSDQECNKPDYFQISSSIARELSFATHHAIHHLAFIALQARRRQYEVNDDFGVSPSTVHRWRKKGEM